MKIILLISLVFSFSLCAESTYQKRQLLKKVKSKDLIASLRGFVGCCRPNRVVGTNGHDQALAWLIDEIKQLDKGKGILKVSDFSPDIDYAVKTFQNEFEKNVAGNFDSKSEEYKKWKGYTDKIVSYLKLQKEKKGKNLVWSLPGTGERKKVLLIGTHYDQAVVNQEKGEILFDTVAEGADDNGTGVAVLLQMIKFYSANPVKHDLKIIFYDYGELAQLGSRAFVKNEMNHLSDKEIIAHINPIMLGHDTKREDTENRYRNFRIYGRPESSGGKQDRSFADKFLTGVKSYVSGGFFRYQTKDLVISDSDSFSQFDFPVLTFSQNWENDLNKERQHTPQDFVETLNINSFTRSFLHLLAGTRELLIAD